ncbi:MAG: DNA-binding response regulator [Chromatiales bacterium]|jgi:DNA-binding NarL/FixJ family response regulator
MNDTTSISTVVLVVDDSPESLGMLNIALGQAGYTVLVALSGLQAQSILDKVEPDVILLDAVMPEMDGFETCKLIKQTHPDIPVIFMTGLSDEENIVSGFAAGGVDYITKPIKPSEVIARIQVHVNNARLKASTQDALDTTGKHILELNQQGDIVWATQQAKKLLDTIKTLEAENQDTFQQRLQNWLEQKDERSPLVFKQDDTTIQLTYLSAQKDQHHLVQLAEREPGKNTQVLTEHLPVTQREAEVLLWLSHGKTNREIAQILDISPRTVNKHLEVIFRKLEVDNRTAAAGICLKVINSH